MCSSASEERADHGKQTGIPSLPTYLLSSYTCNRYSQQACGPTHVVTHSGAPHFSLCFRASILDHFFPKKLSSLLLLVGSSCCLKLSLIAFLKDIFTAYRSIVWKLFSFTTLKILKMSFLFFFFLSQLIVAFNTFDFWSLGLAV